MWTKICGNKTLEDAKLAVAQGADAIGFVFVDGSKRRTTPEAVGQITRQLPRTIETYGVFAGTDADAIVDAARVAGLGGVQLHAPEESGLAAQLRRRFAAERGNVRILQVLHYEGNAEDFALRLRRLRDAPVADAVLLDSRTATEQGGTGKVFDWAAASAVLDREAQGLRVVVAGGLRPENVRQAILTLRPWGVDVSSGVESAPGRKDPQRVAAFVRAARDAGEELLRSGMRMPQ